MIHCVLWERRTETAVVWYRNDEVQGAGEFCHVTLRATGRAMASHRPGPLDVPAMPRPYRGGRWHRGWQVYFFLLAAQYSFILAETSFL